MNTQFLKVILLLVVIALTKHSNAQNANVVIDSVNARTKRIADRVNQASDVKSVVSGDTLKNKVMSLPDQPKKDSTTIPISLADTLKDAVITLNKISGNSIIPLKPMSKANKADTVYLIEIAEPIATQSNITIDAGQNFTTFKFIDSKGNIGQNYTHNITGSYSLGYQYIKNNGIFYRANIGMRKAGASLLNDGINYNWNIQYAMANIGAGYMLNLWRIKPYFSVSPYFGYMLKGNQTIGTDNIDIKQNTSMKFTDFGFLFEPGIKLILSKSIIFYAEYKYILGLQNLEKSANEKSFNRGFSFNLGLSFNIIMFHKKLVI